MRILHLSSTPLVGAPLRICRALNQLPGIAARSAVAHTDVGAYGTFAFANDLVVAEHAQEISELAESADLIHLHNLVDLDNREFGIDLRALWQQGKPILRQFHSTPAFLARISGQSEQALLSCPLPRLVIAQYPERFLPDAALVPNIAFAEDEESRPARPTGSCLRIGYAPSRFNSAHSARWDTKGYPETKAMLRRLEKQARGEGLELEIDLIENQPHARCLARKADCDLIIDDLVTGSYHLNTLESLASGRAVMDYLDPQTLAAQSSLAQGQALPVINTGLEHAQSLLLDLVREPELARELGRRSKAWMNTYWAPKEMAQIFLAAYQRCQEQPQAQFPSRVPSRDPLTRWLTIDQFDTQWSSRRQMWPAQAPRLWRALRSQAWQAAHRLGWR